MQRNQNHTSNMVVNQLSGLNLPKRIELSSGKIRVATHAGICSVPIVNATSKTALNSRNFEEIAAGLQAESEAVQMFPNCLASTKQEVVASLHTGSEKSFWAPTRHPIPISWGTTKHQYRSKYQ